MTLSLGERWRIFGKFDPYRSDVVSIDAANRVKESGYMRGVVAGEIECIFSIEHRAGFVLDDLVCLCKGGSH